MIYFVKAGKYVKIGFTGRDVKTRMADMQTGNPEDLEVLVTIPGNKSLETFLHKLFRPQRFRGEWFKHEGDLEQLIEDLTEVKRRVVIVARGEDPESLVNSKGNFYTEISLVEENKYAKQINLAVGRYIQATWDSKFTSKSLKVNAIPVFFRVTQIDDPKIHRFLQEYGGSLSYLFMESLLMWLNAEEAKESEGQDNSGSRGNPSELF